MLCFKSTRSLTFRSVDPRLEFWDPVWSGCYWRTHFSSFLAILPLFCSRVRSKCSSSSSALEIKRNEIIFLGGGQSSTPLFPRPSGWRYLGASGRLPGPPTTSGLKFQETSRTLVRCRASTRPHRTLTASLVHPGPWRARHACSPGPPAHPAGAALVASAPQSSASLQTGGSLSTAGPLHTLPPLPAFSSFLVFLHKPYYRTTS